MAGLRWLHDRDVRALHERLIALHGGAPGIRDEGLLEFALSRRQHSAHEAVLDVVGLAALYTSALVRNHPFVDGNKRTAFVAGILFMELNGYRFHADEPAAAHAVEALAEGALAEAQYEVFLRENSTAKRKR